jgi:1-acyl-sn-glycerol-3-phosphate acyltransferase
VLPEKPNRVIQFWWNSYCRRAIRKHFHALRLYGHFHSPADTTSADAPRPATLYLANHLSFWDGIVAHHVLLQDRGHRALRIMVDENQVRRHPFFRRVGAFSVNRQSPRDGLRAIEHAARLLEQGLPVLLFPQGAIRPVGEDLRLERGFTYLLDRAPGASVVVLNLAYEFWEHQRPEVLLHASEPLPGKSFGLEDALKHFAAGADALRQASLSRNPGRIVLQREFDIRSLRFPGSK